MRFMILLKATPNSEAGTPPDQKLLSEMGKFNQQLIDAGVMLDGNGLRPSRKAARVQFGTGKRTVIDGPFAETKELVAGYWIWQCKDLAEAVEWVKRCPDPMPGEETEIEIRELQDLSDFPDLPEDVRKMEESFRSSQK